jgi:tetratricopeptide (TPR) repeat protein
MGLFSSKKDKRYFSETDFEHNFSIEVSTAIEVYEQMLENGFEENALTEMDYTFSSNTKEKLIKISDFLNNCYENKVQPCKKEKDLWILECKSAKLPFNEESLIYWALDLYCKGFEFDCKLVAYGSFINNNELTILDLSKDTSDKYFEIGVSKIDNRNYGEAIIYLSIALQLDPKNEEAYQARGYCKDEIKVFLAAREDYDKAIEIDPNYIDALLLRGANFDDAEAYESAIVDYNKVIDLDPENGTAFLNRGNTKLSMGDKKGACQDWKIAVSLGIDEAQDYIDEECG